MSRAKSLARAPLLREEVLDEERRRGDGAKADGTRRREGKKVRSVP